MRRTIVLLAAIAAMVVVYAGTALAEDTLDAHYSLNGTEPSYTGFDERNKQGQTFTAENTGDLNKAEVTVNRGYDTSTPLYMDIVSVDASGEPTDNVLASASLPASQIVTYGGGSKQTFTFDNPAVVRAGKQYAFVLHGGNTTTYFFALAGDSYSGSPGYPGGKGYWLNPDYSVMQEIRDHLFAIYVAPRDVPDVTGPVLSLPDDITQEAEGSGGAAVSWSATATDDVDASVTVTCDPDSGSTFAIGTTQVNCSATDAAENTTPGSFNVTVGDTTAPTVSLTAPASGATVRGTQVTLSASASDEVGVTKVEFLVDGQVADTDTTAPYSTSWDSTTVSDGNKTIQAKAYDAANNETSSSSVDVIVENTSPPDTTPPTVDEASLSPSKLQTGVQRNISPTATFSEEIAENTLTNSTVVLQQKVRKKIKGRFVWRWVSVNREVSCDTTTSCQTVTIDPYPLNDASLLGANRYHRVIITTGVKDKAGNTLPQRYVWSFKTGSA